MVSFNECRLFGEGAAGSPDVLDRRIARRKPLGQPSGFVGSPVAGGSEWQ